LPSDGRGPGREGAVDKKGYCGTGVAPTRERGPVSGVAGLIADDDAEREGLAERSCDMVGDVARDAPETLSRGAGISELLGRRDLRGVDLTLLVAENDGDIARCIKDVGVMS